MRDASYLFEQCDSIPLLFIILKKIRGCETSEAGSNNGYPLRSLSTHVAAKEAEGLTIWGACYFGWVQRWSGLLCVE